jgi:ferritin
MYKIDAKIWWLKTFESKDAFFYKKKKEEADHSQNLSFFLKSSRYFVEAFSQPEG